MKFEFGEISQIAAEICEALKFSYELDIIHGDIKPSNVLLQYNGTAKLSDFGMARRVSGETDNSIGGTPNYIAPELLRGEKPSIQSDVYALGVTLYEMSFGELPVTLTGRSIPEWIKIHDDQPCRVSDALAGSIAGVLARATVQNVVQRSGRSLWRLRQVAF